MVCLDANREYERTRNKTWGKRREAVVRKREMIQTLKLQTGCVDCGYAQHPEALDFDHLPGFEKLARVSNMVNQLYSDERINDEIAKCEVVCANCHRICSARRRNGQQN